jgi:hypothetical protein
LQGVSRLSDIDRRDLLVVLNPASPDALERRLNSACFLRFSGHLCPHSCLLWLFPI